MPDTLESGLHGFHELGMFAREIVFLRKVIFEVIELGGLVVVFGISR